VLQLDTSLNLVWALFCVAAAAYYVRAERGRARRGGNWARLSRAVALFLAVVSLFPCVSASDDQIRIENLEWGAAQAPAHGHPGPAHAPAGKSHAILVRMLESLESVQVPQILALAVTLSFFALVPIEWREGLERQAPMRAGRDPPCLLLLPDSLLFF
jgi:hypothetical protein